MGAFNEVLFRGELCLESFCRNKNLVYWFSNATAMAFFIYAGFMPKSHVNSLPIIQGQILLLSFLNLLCVSHANLWLSYYSSVPKIIAQGQLITIASLFTNTALVLALVKGSVNDLIVTMLAISPLIILLIGLFDLRCFLYQQAQLTEIAKADEDKSQPK